MSSLSYAVNESATVIDIEQRRAEYMGNPQVDDGHTRIANELLEAILLFDLSSVQLKVALCVIRKTYGFNKKADRLAQSVIAEMTNVAKPNVCRAIKQLSKMKVVLVDTTKFPHEICINKRYKEWSNSYQSDNSYQIDSYQNDNEKVINSITKPLSIQQPQKKERKKDTQSFDFCAALISSGVPNQVAKDYMATRKGKRLSPTKTAFDGIISEVEKSGLTLEQAITICCRKGWGSFDSSWLKPEDRPAIDKAGRPKLSF